MAWGEMESEPATILVADDDSVTRHLLRHHLETAGYRILEAQDGKETLQLCHDDVAVALVDLHMPAPSGLECLRQIRQQHPDVQVMMISGRGEIRDAVAAMKQGAVEYITKPFEPEELLARVQQATRASQLAREHRTLRTTISGGWPQVQFVARSATAKQLVHQVQRVAQLDATVLILGPSGTGKSTLARMIHQTGPRSSGPFVAVSCATLPRELIESELFGHERGAFTGADAARAGWVEVAHRGTLFLDEIGDLPLELQPKLLTFLQDRTVQRLGGKKIHHVDVRVIAATHQDLEAMCRQKTFRQDLFFRLNVLTLRMPPLNQRREDIIELAERSLARLATQRGVAPIRLSPEASAALMEYSWPGNLRELENVLERASAFCAGNEISGHDLVFDSSSSDVPRPSPGGSLAGITLEELERQAIRDTLAACSGNRAAAARQLGISERTVYNKIRQLGLENE